MELVLTIFQIMYRPSLLMGCGTTKQQPIQHPGSKKKEKTVVFKEPPVDVINYIRPYPHSRTRSWVAVKSNRLKANPGINRSPLKTPQSTSQNRTLRLPSYSRYRQYVLRKMVSTLPNPPKLDGGKSSLTTPCSVVWTSMR